jgi:hypothetical protein
VEIVYYNDRSMKLATIIDNQVWKYDPAIKGWYITTLILCLRIPAP